MLGEIVEHRGYSVNTICILLLRFNKAYCRWREQKIARTLFSSINPETSLWLFVSNHFRPARKPDKQERAQKKMEKEAEQNLKWAGGSSQP